MRLGDILSRAGHARALTPRPVSFNVIGEDEHMQQTIAKVECCMIFVSEAEREKVRVELHADLGKRFADKMVPDTVVRDEEIYHLLIRALRDKDPDENGYHQPLAASLPELRASLVVLEARRLKAEYEQFMLEEFPDKIDNETWEALVEEAKKNSAQDLLTKYGYASAVRVLSFLAGLSGR